MALPTTTQIDTLWAKSPVPRTEVSQMFKDLLGGSSPSAYSIGATQTNGTPTALTSGQSVTIFGNSPLSISNGFYVHTPGSGSNQAGYMQVAMGSSILEAGCDVVFPTGSGASSVAMVMPLAAWASGSLSQAGVHFVLQGDGGWHVSNWNGTAEQIYANGSIGNLADGSQRRIVLKLDRARSALTVYFSGGIPPVQIVDSRIASNTGQFMVWELYEFVGASAVPAKIANVFVTKVVADQTTSKSLFPTLGESAELAANGRVLVREYIGITSTGNITPPNVLYALVELRASGPGGGSGRRGAAGTIRGGGSSGGGGGIFDGLVQGSSFGIGYDVYGGVGGLGGAAVTANDTNGNNGSDGVAAIFTTTNSAGAIATIRTIPSAAGQGGTSTGAAQAGAGAPLAIPGSTVSSTGGAGSAGSLQLTGGVGQSGSGGGITSANVPSTGGAGSAAYLHSTTLNGGNGGIVDGATPGVGRAAVNGQPGDGAGGGASSITTNAQSGANAIGYGAGGGGGGASLNGFNSGAGGQGGPSYVRITFYLGS